MSLALILFPDNTTIIICVRHVLELQKSACISKKVIVSLVLSAVGWYSCASRNHIKLQGPLSSVRGCPSKFACLLHHEYSSHIYDQDTSNYT